MWFKPARISQSLPAPASWQEVPAGDWWQSSLAAALRAEWDWIFGEHLLQLGPLSEGLAGPCRTREQYTVYPGTGADVQAELTALPFQQESADAVLAAHVLEYARDPHAVLREINRILRPDGRLLLAVANPVAPAQILRYWPGTRSFPLTSRQFIRFRVQDWLDLMHYEVTARHWFAAGWWWPGMRRSLLEQSGQKWLPWLSGGYVLVARKREWPLTPTRLRQRQPVRVAPGAVPASCHWGSDQH